jgi:arabinogalactan endo-1,4-beta-galactosidase
MFFNTLAGAGRTLALTLALALPVALAGAATPEFAKGADVGWVTQMESKGYVFRDPGGAAADPLALLQKLGMNAVRLRVWVDPAGGWNNGPDTLQKARRAAALGMRIMIDFHYSDNWADPGKQVKPAAWARHDVKRLNADIYAHTHDILDYLKTNGIEVEWVQVGNEINGGMLWPEGSTAKGFANLASFINSGYQAVKAVYPDALVVVHLANGYNDANFRWFFDNLKATGGKWDAIGLSHYPPPAQWQDRNEQIGATMADMVARYGKPVLVAEVGMEWRQAATARAMLADLIDRTRALGANGLGVFYWEPEGAPGWNGYTMGALDESGKFTEALAPFKQ